MGQDSGPESIINIHDRDSRGAGIEHRQKSRKSFKTGSVPLAGGHGDDRCVGPAAHHAGKGAIHSGRYNQNGGRIDFVPIVGQPMQSGNADVKKGFNRIPKKGKTDPGFFSYRNIGGPGRYNQDAFVTV